MDPLALAENSILSNPSAPDSHVLNRLLEALRAGERFDVHELYTLSMPNFSLALAVVDAWRLQRYYRGGAVVPAARLVQN